MTRNILLVVLDDVGVEKFGLYGLADSTPPTPTFDGLARRGILFNQAYGAPICGPCRSAIQTGRYAFRTGFGTNIADADGPDGYRLPDSEVLLPEVLRQAGYACAAFGKWHLTIGTGDDLHPNRNGYSHFAGCMGNTLGAGNGTGMYDWRRVVDGASNFVTGPPFDSTIWHASVVRRDALEWIGQQLGPWFAYVAFNPPHAPYAVPPYELLSAPTRMALQSAGLVPGTTIPSVGSDAKRLMVYDACIEAVDTELHALVSKAGPPGSNTLVIVMGDNGTPGETIQPPYVPQHAKRSLFQQGIRVPMVVAGAGVASPGRISNGLVHAVDLWRTCANVAGMRVSSVSSGRDSSTILPIIDQGAASGPRTRIYCESFKPNGLGPHFVELRTFHDGQYKLLVVAAQEQFYRIETDIREEHDLVVEGMTPAEQDRMNALREEMNELIGS